VESIYLPPFPLLFRPPLNKPPLAVADSPVDEEMSSPDDSPPCPLSVPARGFASPFFDERPVEFLLINSQREHPPFSSFFLPSPTPISASFFGLAFADLFCLHSWNSPLGRFESFS